MDDYNRYVTAVNKIYDYLEKMRAGWNNMDNKNYIDNIDDYKSIVTSRAEEFKLPRTVKVEETENLEEEEPAPVDPHRQQPPPPPMPPESAGYAGGTTMSVGTRNLDVPGLPASFVPADTRIPISEGILK